MFLQMWKEVSITGGDPSIASPLAFILLVTAFKDALEDYERHKYDEEENNRMIEVYNHHDNIFVRAKWGSIHAGSIVRVFNRQQIPADLVLLACSDTLNKVAFVMTAGLDGETNLKQRTVPQGIPEDLSEYSLGSNLECNGPTKVLECFEGTIAVLQTNQEGQFHVSVSSNNMVLRGCQLRNSDWIIGLATYVGDETKLQLNSKSAQNKTSSAMAIANRAMMYIFAMQVLCCVIAAFVSSLRITATNNYPYLGNVETYLGSELFLRFFNYIIIFTNFIPISLMVTVDMVKFGQGFFISWDLGMYHEGMDRRARVNCSELNEELGCVEHIFSDKTGTLTANIMKFKACSMDGVLVHATDDLRVEALRGNQFWTCLAVNHTVVPEISDAGKVVYSAASPDEGALVEAAKANGFEFVSRTPNSVIIRLQDNSVEEFEVLHTIEFTSDRKRSSVIVRTEKGKLVLYCKGADNVILDKLANPNGNIVSKTMLDLNQLAAKGLRTLCIAWKELDEDFYNDWNERVQNAKIDIHDRKSRVAVLEDEMESELSLLGCTAIEDKLQEDVPETIADLRAAGIKVWMLTGDKVDTAVNIGLACALWTQEMTSLNLFFEACRFDGISSEMLDTKIREMYSQLSSENRHGYCLVVDTNTVHALCKYRRMADFLKISNHCSSVICARVSPHQKASIVTAVRDSDPNVKTLAIGDGANDVPMIQTAHVGVGIYGEEGLQASNSADFAIARFKYLKRLMLVHGRWSARRVGILICYMFYKNTILVFPQFFYAFYCLASGQNFYLDFPFYQGYNFIFTSLPVLIFGVLDQDVIESIAWANPGLYLEASVREKVGIYFSKSIFWRWIGEGFVQAVLLTFVLLAILESESFGIIYSDGTGHDLWLTGTVIHLTVTLVVTLRLFVETRSLNRYMSIAYFGSLFLWFFCSWIWSEFSAYIPVFINSSPFRVAGIFHIFEAPTVWLAVVISVVLAFLPTFIYISQSNCFNPSLSIRLGAPSKAKIFPESTSAAK